MKKVLKSITLLLITSFILLFSNCFSNANVMNSIKEDMKKAGSTIENTFNDGMNATKNTINDMKNGTENAKNTITRSMTTTNDNYTAERTNTEGSFLGMNSMMWTWLIMAILAVAIIGLVWYYASQSKNSYLDSDE